MSDVGFEICGVSRSYGRQIALDAVTLQFPRGDHAALLGPSGCGKSTLLRILAGLEAPSSGTVRLDGQTVSSPHRILVPPHQRGIAMVFQDLALWPNLSVVENVFLGRTGRRTTKRERRARAMDALALCGIDALHNRLPGTLSGGQQQRVALARAIAAEPSFLFLDEPFASLDWVTKVQLFDEIAELADRRKLTVILVTHDPHEATALCKSAVILKDGAVQECGAFDDLFRDPQSKLLQAFVRPMIRKA